MHHIRLTAISGKWLIVIGVLTTLFTACKKDNVQKAAPPPELEVIEVVQSDIPIHREFVGHVYGEKDIPIRARVEGFLEGIFFEEGLEVSKGQLLYTIDPKPFEAKVNTQQSRVAEARTNLAKAESDLNRYKPLAAVKAVSESDLDAAQAHFDAAVSSLEAAKSNLRSAEIELGYTKIYSPIDGTIGKTEAKVGDFVGRDPNPVILNVVSKIDNVRVEFFITEAEYLVIAREFIITGERESTARANKEKQNLELYLSDGSKYNYNGHVEFIDRGVSAGTGSILVQSTFPNPQGLLRPGMFGKVNVNMGVINNGIKVPQRCIIELQGIYSVFVVNSENVVESRQIEVGTTIADYWVVKSGLVAGDKILIEGLQLVRTGMTIVPKATEFKSQINQE